MKTQFFAAVLASVLLSACANSAEDDLRQWMQDLRAQTKPNVTPLTEPKQFVPAPYTQSSVVDAFSQLRLVQALRKESTNPSSSALIDPERARRKEPLEAFPLDSVKMVGSLNKQNVPTGLIVVDNLLYQVKVGEHIGQNFGRVLKISESEILLRELVEDATGDWVERMTTLKLQEKSK